MSSVPPHHRTDDSSPNTAMPIIPWETIITLLKKSSFCKPQRALLCHFLIERFRKEHHCCSWRKPGCWSRWCFGVVKNWIPKLMVLQRKVPNNAGLDCYGEGGMSRHLGNACLAPLPPSSNDLLSMPTYFFKRFDFGVLSQIHIPS